MNILVICHYGLYQNLSFSFVHNQAKAYVALGHRVRAIILVPYGKNRSSSHLFPLLERAESGGVEIYYFRHLSLSNWGAKKGINLHTAVSAVRNRLQALLDGFQPDIIHAHTLGFDSELGAWLKERLGCPLVVTTHGSDTVVPIREGRGAQIKQFAETADTVVCVSSKLKRALEAENPKVPLEVILNGFEARFVNIERKKTHSLELNQTGSLIELKKTDVTIRAFAMLCPAHPEAVLTIVGDGPDRSALERLCAELDVTGNVRFLGQLPNEKALAQMAEAQFFIMPSVREGFGIVYLEAMASGCITIGTEGEGIADLIVSGQNGFLVPPDDPKAIVQIVEWCLEHPEEAAAIAERGRADAMGLTWETNAKRYIALFERMMADDCLCSG